MVCLVHNDLYEVNQSGDLPYYKVDMLCHWCVEGGWEKGELIRGEDARYINFR